MNTEPTDRSDALAGDPEGKEHLIPVSDPNGAAPDPFDAPTVDTGESPRRRADTANAARAFWKELPVLIVVALVVAVLIKTFLVQAFYIPSGSMRDTLEVGDRVMVNKLAYRFGEPAGGDVIVFDSPLVEGNGGESLLSAIVRNIGEALGLSTPESALIKRVIAVGGDTLEIDDNRILINGNPLDEPYLTRNIRMSDYGPIEVPADHVFVMGDNRNQSEDSRVFGPIHESTIIGRAFVKVWPPGRLGGL